MTGGSKKACCECGIDVSGRKRMKDSQGRYWCYECGTADQMRKGKGSNGSLCPDCSQMFPPVKLMKHENQYVCPDCYEMRIVRERERAGSFFGRLGAALKGGGGTDEGSVAEAARQKKLFIALAVMVVATIIYYKFFNGPPVE